MKVIINRKPIFKNTSDVEYNISTDPKIVSFRRYWDGESKSFLSVYDIEIYCIVDQRNILEEDISKIEVYMSANELSHYDRPQPSAYSLADINSPKDVNNITFDLVNIQESEGLKKFDDHVYLTSLEPHQNFNKFPARKSNVDLLTDAQAFGVTPKYIVSQKRPPRVSKRRSQVKTGDKYLDFLEIQSFLSPSQKKENIENTAQASRTSFATNYRKLIMQGIDPMSIFQRPDRGQGLSEFLKGTKTIDKCINHNHNLRKIVKKMAANFDTTGMSTPFGVRKVNVPNRIVRLKTKMTMTLRELLALNASGDNLIFYALDSKNNKVDSENYQFSIEDMLRDLRKKRPAYKFDASASRNRYGFISTAVQNHEKKKNKLERVFKKIANGRSLIENTFELTDGSVVLGRKQRKILLDGSDNKPTLIGPRFGSTCPVFHRFTTDFMGKEISNSKSAYVGASRSFSGGPTSSFYAIINQEAGTVEGSINIKVTNVSNDVMKMSVLKRRATNSIRGQNFKRLVKLSGATQDDIFIDQNSHDQNNVYTFEDGDVEDETMYEYAVDLTNRSGYTQRLGSTFRETYEKPSNAIAVSVMNSETKGGSELPGNVRMLDGTMTFSPTISIKTLTSDVDKLLNSIFDEKHELFLNEFKDIKDTSNLIYGARVHRINKTLGTMAYVGNFTARKSRSKNEDNEAIPQEHFVVFRDEISPFYKYVYKIEPFVLPPSQVLNKVSMQITNITRKDFNKKASFGRYQSSASSIRKLSSAKKKISTIGSKFASVRSNKGRISSDKSLLEKSGNSLFADGYTGDIIYHSVEGQASDFFTNIDVVKRATIKKTTFYSRAESSSAKKIRKAIIEIIMNVDGDDRLTDFYIILRRENTQKDMLIDGVIHSTDDPARRKSYTYMSKCRGSIGAIEYFALPIFKNGEPGQIEPLGIHIVEE